MRSESGEATRSGWRLLLALVMGFAGGVPLMLTITLLQAWMQQEGVDLGTIGLFALVGLPYTVKFAWAPLLDRYTPWPLGRRRGWLLTSQLLVILSILGLARTSPAENPLLVAVAALALTFFSATQDTVIDAYRRESLSDHEQGLGAALYVNGYRFGNLLVSGGGLILADLVGFTMVYVVMAGVMLVGVVATVVAPEPESRGTPPTLAQAVIEPIIELFSRRDAVPLLLFILLYKLGDSMASHMSTAFYLDMGYSTTEIGAVVKLIGFWPIIAGTLLGGSLILKVGLYRSLWIAGILQGVSTAGFAWLASLGHDLTWLAAVISFENVSMGLGMAALLALMATLTDRRFTATQFALLSSLTGVPRVILSAPTGFLADAVGWHAFFVACAVIAIPGLLLLLRFRDWLGEDCAGAYQEVDV